MPLGRDDYDIVIGVSVDDQTATGSASVRHSLKKTGDDIRTYSDKQAREIASNTRTTFSNMDRDMSRSATGIVKKLTYVFDSHNFLLRNMARQAGSTTGAIAIGVGKLALSYTKLGKDSEEAAHRSRVAMADLRQAVSRLGSDSNAFPAAIKAARDLSAAYERMGMTGHMASTRAGSALETAVHKRVILLQSGLDKARTGFEKLRISASSDSEKMAKKITDISASISQLLGGVKVDAPFFKSFVKARTDLERYKVVLDQLGPKAAVAFSSNQGAVDKLVSAYIRLERTSTRSIKTQADKLNESAAKIRLYQKELALLEKGLNEVTTSTGEAAVATRIFSGSMVAAGVAVGAAVAAILILIAAVAAFVAMSYKGATTAAAYGNEIYKLSLSTGLTVKTLSTLNVIARETNTEVDSLAKTFTRTQIQIQRGLDKPFSEAGRALRTLKVDFAELRKANPDQQVFTLAKAFTELNNQNVRATVSQQMFSRDSERQAKMLEQVANGFEEAQKKAKRFGLELDESGAVKANKATVAIEDMRLAWEGLWVTLGIQILPQLSILMQDFAEWVAKTGGAFSFLGQVANAVLFSIRVQIAEMKEFFADPIEAIKNPFDTRGKAMLKVAQEDAAYQLELNKRVEELKRRGLQGDDQYAPGRGAKSLLDNLLERVKKLRFEITALQETGSRENRLRFELEDLEKVKSGFESIFKLRNQMGLTLDQPLPEFRLFGTSEEQQQDLDNLQSYIQQMERMKIVFDGVRKVANEQHDALSNLARVQQEALMPVVDAGTLAAIKYNTAIRDRAKAERELTADVITETRLRKDAIEDEVGSTLKAYMTLQRDLGRSQDKVREQRKEDQIFLKIVRGDIDTEATIREGIRERMGNIQAPIVPDELTTIAAHAATIDLNVAAIAEKIGANVSQTSTSNIVTQGSSNSYAVTRLVKRNEDGTITIVSEQDQNPDVVKTQSTDVEFLRRRITNESRERAGAERDSSLRAANQRIIDNQMRMEQALIDLDTDYVDKWTQLQVSRRESARETVVSIMLLENDLRDLSNTNSELYKNTWKQADEERLRSLKSTKEEIINLQNDIANNGFDQTERLQKARLQGIRDIQEESNKARESIVYNQQIIADQTIYHSERADAAVIDFLAHQRGITEVIADAKVGVIDATFSAIDSGLDRLTEKLGAAGDIVKDLISGFLRLALSPFFRAMFGGQGGSGGGGIFGNGGIFGGGGGGGIFGGQGGQTQGGISGLPGVITNLIGSGDVGLSAPTAISGIGGFTLPGATGGIHEVGHTIASAGAGLSKAGIMTSLGGALPFLGLGIGANLGGKSRTGSILGGAGGLIAGGVGAAFLAPSLFASTGVLGSLGPAALGLLTNPFTAVVAGGLIVGSILLGRAKRRKQEEESRDLLKEDVFYQLSLLLAEARRGMDPVIARLQAQKLVDDYYRQIDTFKTKSVRQSAENYRPFFNAKIQAIVNAAMKAEQAQENLTRISPEFADGGSVWNAFSGRVPGIYDRRDDKWIRVSGREAVLTPFNISRLPHGEFTLGNAGVPGYPTSPPIVRTIEDRGVFGEDSGISGPISLRAEKVVLMVGTGDATEIVFEGLRQEKNKKVVRDIKTQSDSDRR